MRKAIAIAVLVLLVPLVSLVVVFRCHHSTGATIPMLSFSPLVEFPFVGIEGTSNRIDEHVLSVRWSEGKGHQVRGDAINSDALQSVIDENASRIVFMDASRLDLTERDAEILKACKAVRWLNISGQPRLLDAEWLSSLSRLDWLYLQNQDMGERRWNELPINRALVCNLSYSVLPLDTVFPNCDRLHTLLLDGVATDEIVIAVLSAKMPSLHYLSVGKSAVTDKTVSLLSRHTRIVEINLFGCKSITDDSLSRLTQMKHLKNVAIGETALSDRAIDLIEQSLGPAVVDRCD